MPAIGELGAEHELLLDLSDRVRRAIAGGDDNVACDQFGDLVEILEVHTAVEEAGLFAALGDEGELDEHVAALLGDHTAAWASVEAISRAAADGWDLAVCAFLDDLRAHIEREEYDLFPASIVALSPSGWERVAAARPRP